MRAARLHGPGDLRIEDVPDPEPTPERPVVVAVEAATACGTDRKSLVHGHRMLGPYPCGFGHETAGVRTDTGERVFVSDSVACAACAPCLAARSQICRSPAWVVGGFAEQIAAPEAALHPIPDGLPAAGAAMAEPLAAAVHAVQRSGPLPSRAAILGGGTMGLMLARLLVLRGCVPVVADRHAERRAQAASLGAATGSIAGAPLVFEAIGRPEAWREAVAAAAPGGRVVLVGGCPGDADVPLPAAPIHYDEIDVLGAFHHSPADIDAALALLGSGDVPWEEFAGPTTGLEGLAAALAAMPGGRAAKPVVVP